MCSIVRRRIVGEEKKFAVKYRIQSAAQTKEHDELSSRVKVFQFSIEKFNENAACDWASAALSI